jgi:hypothetical protein
MWRLGWVLSVFLLLSPTVLQAGPPFTTDDPEPVEYRHWEVYLATQLSHDSSGWSGSLPQVEINYGAVPNLQLHLIAPVTFLAPRSGPTVFGYGDTELGAKCRFVQQTKFVPEVATFPLIELPSGNESRGLGSGHTQFFFPIWLQKDIGKWTTYGGGGYWVNPGPDNQNWWFVGWLVQRQVTSHLTVGAEVFHETAQQVNGESDTIINGGGIFDLNDTAHLLFSLGHTVQGPSSYQAYFAIQFTFGPKEKEAK